MVTETAPPADPPRRFTPRLHRTWQRVREKLIEWALRACGLLSIGVTLAIVLVVLKGTIDFFCFKDAPEGSGQVVERMTAGESWDRVVEFFTETHWTAGFDDARYGIVPLLLGTLVVTAIAALVALPLGLATALYLSEYAPPRVRSIAKPTLELLAGIPTVVYGFFAVTALTPMLGPLFEENLHGYDNVIVTALSNMGILPLFPGRLGDPHNQIAGGLVVGIMILPMVASLSEDALRAVPRSLRDAAFALGANRYETSTRVVLPAALSGVTASFLLALARALGETMAVSLACGITPTYFLNLFTLDAHVDPRAGSATMTSFIVGVAQGEVQHGSTKFNSLFAVAAMLFLVTLGMNIAAQAFIRRYRQVYQ